MKERTIFMIAVGLLVSVFVAATMTYKGEQTAKSEQRAEVNRDALVRMHSPTLGPATAPVTIVEFIDPACETCRAFYPMVKQMLAANPERIRLVLRYAPFHNGSDQVVAVLEAARKQGKFWPALEALLGAQAEWSPNHTPDVNLVWKHLDGLGLDMERLRADIIAPEIGRVIQQDLADAAALGVKMTPEFFVNGRPMPSFGEAQLRALVDEALASAR